MALLQTLTTSFTMQLHSTTPNDRLPRAITHRQTLTISQIGPIQLPNPQMLEYIQRRVYGTQLQFLQHKYDPQLTITTIQQLNITIHQPQRITTHNDNYGDQEICPRLNVCSGYTKYIARPKMGRRWPLRSQLGNTNT